MYGQDFFYSRHKVTGNYGKYDKKADDMSNKSGAIYLHLSFWKGTQNFNF